jgi:hypothetical protein
MLTLAACSSQPPAPPAPPDGAPAAPAPVSASPSASASAPVSEPAPSAPPVFVPAEPLVAPPLVTSNPAERCRVSDQDLGDAVNVVNERQWLYPLRVAFNARGGMTVWTAAKAMTARAIDASGKPAGETVAIGAWEALPTLTAMPEGFVLSRVASKRLELLELGADGKPRGEKVTLELPQATGLVQAVVRTGPTGLAIVGEPERPNDGPMPGVAVHVITVHLEPEPRAELKSLAVKDFYGGGEAFAGTYGGHPALLLLRGSGDFVIAKGTEILSAPLEAVKRDARPTVEPWQQEGGSNAGYDYGLITHPRTPILEREPFPKPGPIRFTLSDPEWRGLPDFQWSGTHFIAGRLSLKGKKTHAKLFAIDCR